MEIVFATHNPNKLLEVQSLLPNSIQLLSLDDIGCSEEIEETSDTVEGNALIKANHVFVNYNYPCFADDTGLFVDALNGEPGVYSARYAGDKKNTQANNNKLLENMEDIKNRKAYFKTVIAFKTIEITKTFTGICSGEILKSQEGKDGFGYDPIFKPDNFEISFASMKLNKKNQISHRALALKKFIEYITSINF